MNKFELAGIAIQTPSPIQYLQVLSQTLKTIPFYSTALRNLVTETVINPFPAETRIDHEIVSRVLGFVGHELITVLDREWHDYEGNEADYFFEYASSRRLFASAKSVFIWGAGSCRLADYLASHDFIDEVFCADLSWPALYFGRSMIGARYTDLPGLLTADRTFYHVDPQTNQLSKTSRSVRFKAPMTPAERSHIIRFAVRDAFAALSEPITAELIALPYVLDNFRGDQCLSFLIRICQQIRAGQQIVLIVTCMAEGRTGPGRDPALIINTLRSCGFKIQYLDLVFLPYSFSFYSYTQSHSDWCTLVLRAERVIERSADIVIERCKRTDPFCVGHADNAIPFDSVYCDLLLSKVQSARPYQALASEMVPQLGAIAFECAVGELASRGLIKLGFPELPMAQGK